MNVERSNPVRFGGAVEGRLAPVGSRDAFELWLCAKRLTGTTEDFYAGITNGEVP